MAKAVAGHLLIRMFTGPYMIIALKSRNNSPPARKIAARQVPPPAPGLPGVRAAFARLRAAGLDAPLVLPLEVKDKEMS